MKAVKNARAVLLEREGTLVWVENEEESWVEGTVVSAVSNNNKENKKTINVKLLSNGNTVQYDSNNMELSSMDAKSASKVEDLTKLPNLHEPGLLLTLHERFKVGEIYTFTGPILLAVNPFKKLPNIYSDQNLKKYLTAQVGQELPPHAWLIADRSFKLMAQDSGKNQSILVSGESGAGKTETTKIVMRYLTLISRSATLTSSQQPQHSHAISDRVLQLNPLIEAFGNAKTCRNDNSSRFGKLIQLKFDPNNGKLCGCFVDTYLLEKARVVNQAVGERNYHIFYELAAGASSNDKAKWGLTSLKDFNYTNQSNTFTRSDVTDEAQFKDTLKALDIVGLSDVEKNNVFQTVMCVLHLGNLNFEAVKNLGEKKNEEGCTVITNKSLEYVSKLLGVEQYDLINSLTTRKVNVGFGANSFASGITDALGLSETFTKYFNLQQAKEAKDALAMTLYDRLFSWIIWRINESISKAATDVVNKNLENTTTTTINSKDITEKRRTSYLPPSSSSVNNNNNNEYRPRLSTLQDGLPNSFKIHTIPKDRPPTLLEQEKQDPTDRSFLYDYTIGCLDIFGFEIFQKNSFEQLCINYANESLQQQFNEFVFELEQKVYQGEGIDWKYVSFPDNKPTLEMIEAKPIGLLSLIDEECMYPSGDDKTLANKLYANLPTKYDRFVAEQKDRINRKFVIRHFAGNVKYDVDGMYTKNKNELHQELIDLVRNSKRLDVAVLMPADPVSAALGLKQPGVKNSTTNSMETRLEELKKSKAGSNMARIQQKTVGAVFKHQLSLAMAHIRASQPHYVRCLKPNDLNKPDIFKRPRMVEQLRYSGVLEVVKVARAGYPTRFKLLDFCKRYYALVGNNKGEVLPTPGSHLQNLQTNELKSICEKIVKNTELEFGEDYQIGKTKVFLRPATFTRLEIAKADRLRVYVVKIQRLARGFIIRRKYVFRRRAAVKIQAFYRGYKVRCKVYRWRRERKAVKLIQKHVRGFLVRSKYDPIFNARADAAWVIHRALRRRILQIRLQVIKKKNVEERAAVLLQSLARVIKAQKIANSLYVEKVTDLAAKSIQGLSKILKARNQRKLLEKKRLDEKLPENAQFIWYIGPLIVIFLLSNPLILVALFIIAISMTVGGGAVLETQRRIEAEERRSAYLQAKAKALVDEAEMNPPNVRPPPKRTQEQQRRKRVASLEEYHQHIEN